MRKLVALMIAVMLMAPALVLAQDQPATPPPGNSSEQPAPQDAIAAPNLLERAIADLNANDFEQTVLDSSLFILMNPTYSRGYYVRGIAYLNLKKNTEALDDLSKALPFAANIPGLQASIYGTRATVYADNNRLPEALDDLSSAIKISPTGSLYAFRAQLLIEQSDYSSALKDIDSAIQLLPDEKGLYLLRGSANLALGSDADAAGDYMNWIRSYQPQVLTSQPVSLGASFQVDMTADKIYAVPFKVTKGQTVSIGVSAVSGNVDPLIVLLDPDNNPITANDDARAGSTAAAILNYKIPADGYYSVLIAHAGGGTDGKAAIQIKGQ